MLRLVFALLLLAGTARAQPIFYYNYVAGGSTARIERGAEVESIDFPLEFGNLSSNGVALDVNNQIGLFTRTYGYGCTCYPATAAYRLEFFSDITVDASAYAEVTQFFEFTTDGMDLQAFATADGLSDFDFLLNNQPLSSHPYLHHAIVGESAEYYELSLLPGHYRFEFATELRQAGFATSRVSLGDFRPLSVPEPGALLLGTFASLGLLVGRRLLQLSR